MALVLKDRVRETTTVLGTNDATLLGAVTGFQSFSVVGSGNTCYYTISDQSGGNWEVGIGTYSSVGPTLARTTILASSNSGSIVAFPAGTKDVFLTLPAEVAVVSSNNPSTSGYVLTSNGTGVAPSWQVNAGGDVTGPASSTDNSIARFDGTTGKLIKDSGSALTFDGTNFTAPRTQFTTSGSSPASGAGLEVIGGTSPLLFAYNRGTSSYLPLNATASAFGWALSGSDAMTLTSTGLGIGTSSPSYKLEVSSAGTVYAATTNSSAGFTSAVGATSLGALWSNTSSTLPTLFYINGAEVMRLDSSGNVGIGTSSPAGKLDVYQSGAANGQLFLRNAGTYHTGFIGSSSATPLSDSYAWGMFGGPNSYLTGIANSVGLVLGSSIPNFVITRNASMNTGPGVTLLNLDSSGNLGLGVTPSAWSAHKILQVGAWTSFGSFNGNLNAQMMNNSYWDGSAYRYIGSSQASYFSTSQGAFQWNTAPSGTAGDAISFTQAMTLDASGNLGIGISSPGAKLDISGTAGTYAIFLRDSSYSGSPVVLATTPASFATSSANKIEAINSTALYLGTYGSNYLGFGTNSTERMRIDSSGNVGIGTSSPTQKLHIYTASTGAYTRVEASTGTAYFGIDSTGVAITTPTNTAMYFGTNGSERMRIDSSGGVLIGSTTPGNGLLTVYKASTYNSEGTAGISIQSSASNGTAELLLGADNSNSVSYIQAVSKGVSYVYNLVLNPNGGNVGIGTSNPGATLQVLGANSLSTNTRYLKGWIGGAASWGSNAYEELGIGYSGIRSIYVGGNAWDLTFATGTSTEFVNGTQTERMRLDSSGNLGLGVTPSAWGGNQKALQIGAFASLNNDDYSGGFNLSSNVYQSDNTTYRYVTNYYATKYTQSGGQHLWLTAPSGTAGNAITFTQAMTLDASGNLGVGTSSPVSLSEQKHITVNYTGGGTQVSGYNLSVNDTKYASLITYPTNSEGLRIAANTALPMTFWTNSAERMRIDSSGNVGIGTSSPRSKLNVSAATSPGGIITLENGSGSNNAGDYLGKLQYYGNDVSAGSYGVRASIDALVEDTGGSTSLVFSTTKFIDSNLYERMRLDSSGNVGIGTSSPAKKLDVTGTGRVTGEMAFGNDVVLTNDAYIYSSNGGGVRSGFLLDGTNAATRFYTAGSERMRIDSSGGVRIGTTAPLVYSAGTEGLSVYNSGGAASVFKCGGNTYPVASFDTTYGSGTQTYCYFTYSGAYTGSITSSGSTTTYGTASDYRLKENIQPMQNALAVVQQLNPVTYTWKADGSDGQGFIAHELQAVVPDCVTGEKDAVDEEGKPVYQGIDTSFLVATLTKAIQELKAELDATKAEVAALKAN